MRLPNKIFSFEESVLSKFSAVLSTLEKEPLSVKALYFAVKSKTEDISELLELLDCLYALGRIRYDEETRTLHYVN